MTATAPIVSDNGRDPQARVPTEMGMTGLVEYHGRIDEEFLPQLRHDRALKIFQEMRENDPIIGAILAAMDLLMRGVEWRVEPATETPADEEVAATIEDLLFTMEEPFIHTLSEILSFLPYGFSLHEPVYQVREDGVIAWQGWPIRAQQTRDRWVFDAKHRPAAFVQRALEVGQEEVTIPLSRLLHFRTGSHKGNPEGRSILRSAYVPWYYKKHLERMLAIGQERDLTGLPVVRGPGMVLDTNNRTAAEATIATRLRDIAVNVRNDEQMGVVLPSDRDEHGQYKYDLTLLSSPGTRAIDTHRSLEYYDQRIAITAMADFLLLGHEKVGSFALASSKTSLFSVALGAYLDIIAETVNRDAIPRLVALNGWTLDEPPRLVHGDIETPDLQELGEYIAKLSGAGFNPFGSTSGRLENKLLEVANLPTFEPGELEAMQDEQEQQDEARRALDQARRDLAMQRAGNAPPDDDVP